MNLVDFFLSASNLLSNSSDVMLCGSFLVLSFGMRLAALQMLYFALTNLKKSSNRNKQDYYIGITNFINSSL